MMFAGWDTRRAAMVDLIEQMGVRDKRVLSAMRSVKRHLFVPEDYRASCDPYGNHPCPIGYGQTISQPFIVAYMLEKMNLAEGDKVLEIGTGSGYEAEVLAAMGACVYTVEIVRELAAHARGVMRESVHLRHGDGYLGWPEAAPFDSAIVSCAPEELPEKLVDQLKEAGRMILPLGKYSQQLIVLKRKDGNILRNMDMPVRFVPMVRADTK